MTHICKTKKTGNECSAWVVYVDPEDIPFLSMFNQLHINENNSMYTTASDLFTPLWCMLPVMLAYHSVVTPRGQEMMLIALGQKKSHFSPPEAFCGRKICQNVFAAGSVPQTLLQELMMLLQIPLLAGKGDTIRRLDPRTFGARHFAPQPDSCLHPRSEFLDTSAQPPALSDTRNTITVVSR